MLPREEWGALFDAIRDTLREQAALPSSEPSPERDAQYVLNQQAMDADLAWARSVSFDVNMTDDELWTKAVQKPFFAGKRAGLIADRVAVSGKWLADYREVAGPRWEDGGDRLSAFNADPTAYQNTLNLPKVIRGAKNLVRQQRQRSVSLVDLLIPVRERGFSADDMMRIHKHLQNGLQFGFVTILHVMTDLGLPVVKTDRVVTRMMIRLGLVQVLQGKEFTRPLPRDLTADDALKLVEANPSFSWQIQAILKEMADETGLSMREIDWLLVKMGMDQDVNRGFVQVICSDVPKCSICKAQTMCRLGRTKLPGEKPRSSKKPKRSYRIRDKVAA